MKLCAKIRELNYGDVTVKVMPLLGNAAQNHTGTVGKTVAAISLLPEELIHNVFDAIPTEQKNEVVTAYVIKDAAGKQCVQLKLSSIFVQA